MTSSTALTEAHLPYATFVSDQHRLIYVETPKAACTFWKTALLKMEGASLRPENPLRPSRERKASLLIHDRALNPMRSLSTWKEIKELQHQGYWVFAAVRDPESRTFSAWASKILTREGDVSFRLLRNPDFPVPRFETETEIRESFAEFITYLYQNEYPNFTNHHWQYQSAWLGLAEIRYDALFPSGESRKILDQLLVKRGLPWAASALAVQNESVVAYHPGWVTAEARAMIQEMYAPDYSLLGFDLKPKPAVRPLSCPPPGLLQEVVMKNERIHTLLGYFSQIIP